jgi:hypothetical protein
MKTGKKHGADSNSAFDSWFRYPAGFSAEALDTAFKAISSSKAGPVLDPFTGVGTVGTRARSLGRDFVGIEAHPLVARIARLKLNRPRSPKSLVRAAERVVKVAVPEKAEDEAELVTRCFSADILEELLGLRSAISAEEEPWDAYLELALLSLLRDHASVKVGWPYQLPGKPRQPRLAKPRDRFLVLCRRMATDLEAANSTEAWVTCGDSRKAAAWDTARRREPTAMISSPPYLNNFDYADATRLELYFSKRVSSWAEMCDTVRSGMVVASTQQSKRRDAEQALAKLEVVPDFHERVCDLVAALCIERKQRPSGKHYDWMVSLYFRDLLQVLLNVKRCLPKNAPIVWVIGDSAPYGIYLDTPKLLNQLGEALGFRVFKEEQIRSRGKRWRTNGSRHQVDLCEKQLVWKAPGYR